MRPYLRVTRSEGLLISEARIHATSFEGPIAVETTFLTCAAVPSQVERES